MHHIVHNHDGTRSTAKTRTGFTVGTVGAGPGLETVAELTAHADAEHDLPRLSLIACAGPDLPALFTDQARALGASLHADCATMLNAHPEIDLLVVFSEDPMLISSVRQTAHPGLSIVDGASLAFLQALVIMAEASGKCKADLQGHVSMLHSLMDEIQDEVLFLDADRRILDVNRHVCNRLGKDKNELLGRLCSTVVSDGGTPHCKPEDSNCPFHSALRSGRNVEVQQTWVNEKGRAQYFRVCAFPVSGTGKDAAKVVEIRQDITLRTEIEKRLQQTEKLAAIGELSTYIAHEIRNPLFSIGGFANSLLRTPELTESSRGKARIILEESKRLDSILKRIINFARPTSADSSELDVNTIVQDTIQLISIGCENRGITVEMQLGDNVAKARGNAELLKQCLINLIKNAQEAMPETGTLTVSTGMEARVVIVRVADTGVGIPLKDQEMIFNPFFTTKKNQGAGLGLAMTKKIIGDLGGALHLQSQVGAGTTVTISLPPFITVDS